VSYRGLDNPDLATEPASRVAWQIEPDQDGICLLSVVHDQLEHRRHGMDARPERTQNAPRSRNGINA